MSWGRGDGAGGRGIGLRSAARTIRTYLLEQPRCLSRRSREKPDVVGAEREHTSWNVDLATWSQLENGKAERFLQHQAPWMNRETDPPPVPYRLLDYRWIGTQLLILIRANMAVTRTRTTIVRAVNTGSGMGINGKDTW